MSLIIYISALLLYDAILRQHDQNRKVWDSRTMPVLVFIGVYAIAYDVATVCKSLF